MRRALLVLPGLCVLVLGLCVTTWAQGSLAQSDVNQLVTQDAKYVKDTLAKATLDKKSQKRVRIAALMIAHYAQSGIGKDNPKSAALATLRDKALGVLQAVDGGKVEEARKLAQALAPDIAAEAGAKTEPVALDKQLAFDALMKMFSSERAGGFGMEKDLEDLAEIKGPLEAGQADKIRNYANKVGAVGSLAHAYTPEKDDGKKTRQAWTGFANDMQAAAAELAATAKAGQANAIVKSAEKLSGSCTKCHDVFR